MKNIETFLNKVMDIDVTSTKRDPGKRMSTERKLTAYEKAQDTAHRPPESRTVGTSITAARRSRVQLQAILRKRPDLGLLQSKEDADDIAATASLEGDEDDDDDEEGEEGDGEGGDEEDQELEA